MELSSITKKTSNRESAEVVCGWGCKCVVVTNSEGAIAYIDSKYVSSENSHQVSDLDSTADITCDLEVNLVEYKQMASTAQVCTTSRRLSIDLYEPVALICFPSISSILIPFPLPFHYALLNGYVYYVQIAAASFI